MCVGGGVWKNPVWLDVDVNFLILLLIPCGEAVHVLSLRERQQGSEILPPRGSPLSNPTYTCGI